MGMRPSLKILFLLVLVGLIVHIGCEPDEPDDPTSDSRALWIGSWMAEETSTLYPNPITFTVKITADTSTDNKVWISNFYHLGSSPADIVSAIVTVSSITIPQQSVCDLVINGSGLMSGKTINMSYYVNDGADLDQVTGKYTRVN